MKNKSLFPFVAIAGGLISWGLYALFSRFPMMPASASVQAEHVDSAWNGLLLVRAMAGNGRVLHQVMAPLVEWLSGSPLPRVWQC